MHKLSNKLSGQQSGFTLIELVIVIVIIGILAAVAIPNFTDVTDDANVGVANALAGAGASAWATQKALCKNPATSLSSCASGVPTITTCVGIGALVTEKPAGSAFADGATGKCKATVGTGAALKSSTVEFTL